MSLGLSFLGMPSRRSFFGPCFLVTIMCAVWKSGLFSGSHSGAEDFTALFHSAWPHEDAFWDPRKVLPEDAIFFTCCEKDVLSAAQGQNCQGGWNQSSSSCLTWEGSLVGSVRWCLVVWVWWFRRAMVRCGRCCLLYITGCAVLESNVQCRGTTIISLNLLWHMEFGRTHQR